MEDTVPYFKLQYQLLIQSRKVLFEYCSTLTQEDLLNQNTSFGRGGSIRNLLVHIANAYEFWVVKHALKKNIHFTAYPDINSMSEIEELFRSIDKEVFVFLDTYEVSKFEPLDLSIKGSKKKISPFELFTHVITHEFHHKGQVLSISRHLGYTPVDTDIIR